MFIPNGSSRQRRNINLGGASKTRSGTSNADLVLKTAQQEREKRQVNRILTEKSQVIQTLIRKKIALDNINKVSETRFKKSLDLVTRNKANSSSDEFKSEYLSDLIVSFSKFGIKYDSQKDYYVVKHDKYTHLDTLLNTLDGNGLSCEYLLKYFIHSEGEDHFESNDFIDSYFEFDNVIANLMETLCSIIDSNNELALKKIKFINIIIQELVKNKSNVYHGLNNVVSLFISKIFILLRETIINLPLFEGNSIKEERRNYILELLFGLVKLYKSSDLKNVLYNEIIINILSIPFLNILLVKDDILMFNNNIELFDILDHITLEVKNNSVDNCIVKLTSKNQKYPKQILEKLNIIHEKQCDHVFYLLLNILQFGKKSLDKIDLNELISISGPKTGTVVRGALLAANELKIKKKFICNFMSCTQSLINGLKSWSFEAIKSFELDKENRIYSDVLEKKTIQNDIVNKSENHIDDDSDTYPSDLESEYYVSEDEKDYQENMDIIDKSIKTEMSNRNIFLSSVLPSQRIKEKKKIKNADKLMNLNKQKRKFIEKHGCEGVKLYLCNEHVDILKSLFDMDQLKKLAISIYFVGPKTLLRNVEEGISAISFFLWLIYTVAPTRKNEILTSILSVGNSQLLSLLLETLESLTNSLPNNKNFKLNDTKLNYAYLLFNFRKSQSKKDETPVKFSFGLQPDNYMETEEIEMDNGSEDSIEQIWIILTFLCVLLDKYLLTISDNEFFTGQLISLPLVVKLITFLKNVTFCMYSGGIGNKKTLSKYSRKRIRRKLTRKINDNKDSKDKTNIFLDELLIPRIVSSNEIKNILTRCLSQLYSRDSREMFCPKNHWTVIDNISIDEYVKALVDSINEEIVIDSLNNHNLINSYLEDSDSSDNDIDDFDDEDSNLTRRRTNPQSNSANTTQLLNNVGSNPTAQSQLTMNPGVMNSGSMFGMMQSPIGAFGNPMARNNINHKPDMIDTRLLIKRDILTKIPFIIPFEERARIFRGVINYDKEQLGDIYHYNAAKATVHRNTVFRDGYMQLNSLKDKLKNRVMITFIDQFGNPEAGIDGGGVFKEFLTTLCKEAVNTNNGLFASTGDNLLYPSPMYYDKEEQLKSLEFLGRIIGKAMYEGILIDSGFASFFLAKWLGRQSYLDDLHSLDDELYRGLIYLKNTKDDIAEMSLTFSIDEDRFGVAHSIDLVPGGSKIPVTNDNKIRYIYLVANYKLNIQIADQCSSFFTGLRDLIDPRWLRMFNQEELQALVGGTMHPIDVNDLEANSVYAGEYSDTHETIKWFWEVLREDFSQDDLSHLIKFSTGCSRPPLLGFGELFPKFCIRAATDDQQRLPTASTCVNLLKLPVYKTKDVLKNKLHAAIDSDVGFEFS